VVALGLSLGWAGAILLASTPFTDPITSEGASLLNGIGQVLAGALATYLGSTIRAGRAEPPDDTAAREIPEQPVTPDESTY
jgi:hypothetical protein